MGATRTATILFAFALVLPALAAETPPARVLIRPAAGTIAVDGDLSDPGWRGAAEVHEFFELNPGDNTPPKVQTTAYVTLSARARPTRHLEFDVDLAGQSLSLEGRRLFRAQVERLKATYVFRSNLFFRVVGQYARTDFDPSLYPPSVSVPKTEGAFDGSALIGYQLNWQSVLYLGYGDSRTLSEQAQLLRAGRTLFLKIAYAFQR
jgi:hypothetical protein